MPRKLDPETRARRRATTRKQELRRARWAGERLDPPRLRLVGLLPAEERMLAMLPPGPKVVIVTVPAVQLIHHVKNLVGHREHIRVVPRWTLRSWKKQPDPSRVFSVHGRREPVL